MYQLYSAAPLRLLPVLMVVALLFGGLPLTQAGTGIVPVINEFVADHAGTDTSEFVEIFGSPNTNYAAYTVLHLEGDGAGSGTIDSVYNVGTTDANGFWTTGFLNNGLENGSITLLLVSNFSGTVGTDLDTDNDGAFDSTPWTMIVDSVAVSDGGTGDLHYSTVVLGPNYDGVSSFDPGGASRIPNGTDSDSTSDWVRNDFDGEGLPGLSGTVDPGEAYNTPGATNSAVTAPPPTSLNCVDSFSFTLISDVQGTGATSPLAGTAGILLEAIVVGDFQSADNSGLRGFYLQEEDSDSDGDPSSSEGIFVFDNSLDVAPGDLVRIEGTVSEFSSGGSSLTQLSSVTDLIVCGSGNSVTPTIINFPIASQAALEPYEGMYVSFPQTLVATENYQLGRYGQMVLAYGGRLYQPTHVTTPGANAQAHMAQNAQHSIYLDDGAGDQNNPVVDWIIPQPQAPGSTLRLGDTISGLTGIIDHRHEGYRIQPLGAAQFTRSNPRPSSPPDVGGEIKVAAFNVLNYFVTFNSRGANDATEFDRQRTKIISAIGAINADVVGLMEIENHANDAAIIDLVNGLNAALGAGTYEYIATGPIGGDEIRVALIYKPATVTPLGSFAVLDSVDPFNRNSRPPLAQSFQTTQLSQPQVFTVVVNHFKSKGSCPNPGDPNADQGDGQACWNPDRVLAANVLMNWLASDPTGSGDPDYLIIGDLNAYRNEDPIVALQNGGYTDLLRQFQGDSAYSYTFDGQAGYLDYAMANASLLSQVTGTATWAINADEANDVVDYDMSFKPDPVDNLYEPNPFASSDHDPVIVGLFTDEPPVVGPPPGPPTSPPGNSGQTPADDVAQGRPFRDSDYLLKLVDKSVAAVGDTLTYTITFSNPKGITLRQVNITDDLDSRLGNIIIVSDPTGLGVLNGQRFSISNYELLPGQSVTVVIRAQITSRATPGNTLQNLVVLESPDASVHSSNTVSTTILPGSLPATGERSRPVAPLLALGMLVAGLLALRLMWQRRSAS